MFSQVLLCHGMLYSILFFNKLLAFQEHVRNITWNIENPRNFVELKRNKPVDGEYMSLHAVFR